MSGWRTSRRSGFDPVALGMSLPSSPRFRLTAASTATGTRALAGGCGEGPMFLIEYARAVRRGPRSAVRLQRTVGRSSSKEGQPERYGQTRRSGPSLLVLERIPGRPRQAVKDDRETEESLGLVLPAFRRSGRRDRVRLLAGRTLLHGRARSRTGGRLQSRRTVMGKPIEVGMATTRFRLLRESREVALDHTRTARLERRPLPALSAEGLHRY